jgi:UDP-glucose 4-epimerase
MKIRNKRILVTGGAGFIGSHLVDALYKNNHVIILDNFSSGKRENIKYYEENPDVEIVTGDIRDKAFLYKITRDIDIVYHLAVQCLRVSLKDPEINHEVNATGTLNMCIASFENSVKRFVYISSSEVYGTAEKTPMDENHPCRPTTVYGASKLAGEVYALSFYRTYGLNSIVVRPFNTYGPRAQFEGVHGEAIPRFVLRVLNNQSPVIFGGGNQTRDFTFVSDIIRGIIMASECDEMVGQAVNIASGTETSINKLAKIITQKLNREDLKPIFEKSRPGDVKQHIADISKAKKILGYNPRVNIDDGLEHYIGWFKAKNYNYAELAEQHVIFNW